MPEHLGKKKTALQNAPSSLKTGLMQDDKKEHSKVELPQQIDNELRPLDETSPAEAITQDVENSSEEEIKEVKIPPYDAMLNEPVLTKLIVEKYEGEVDENGFFEGEGTIHFVGGHSYKGLLKNKKMNGQGVYCWADGTTYAGEFFENSVYGTGVYSWPDGSIYEGNVKNGFRHGNGVYRCGTCPSMYSGDWVDGMRHGKGVLYFDETFLSYYDGEWQNGTKCGFGMHKYKSGNLYEGEWHDNRRHGKGKMCWFDRGEEYDGEWVNGVQNGKGKHTWYSKRVAVSQYPVRNEYEGDFVNGQRHGFGVFSYASGAKYSGQWVSNVKAGKGEFMFKNGSVFKGMFENDHIVDYPDLMPSGMTTPDIVESGLPVRSQTPIRMQSESICIGSIDAVLDINLKDIFMEEKFDIERQQIEIDEVRRVVLRHMTILKHIYKFYSSLGTAENADNTFVMNRMKFWRLLKDCGLHTVGHTLSQIDLVEGISETREDPHDRDTVLYMRDFVNVLINIAFLLFKNDFIDEENAIAKCVLKMLIQFVLPNACTLKGNLFSSYEKRRESYEYIEQCEEAFQYFRSATNKGNRMKALRIRDFLWMLKDFKLLNKSLTASQFLEAVYNEDKLVLEERSFNLENEVIFLEFFETLLQCSQMFTYKREEVKEHAHLPGHTQTLSSSFTEEKLIALIKDDDDSTAADNVFDTLKTPPLQSPDKGAADAASIVDQSKSEVDQSPTIKTQETSSHGKTSTAGGSRKDHHGGKESGGAGGSRGKRRGTADHVETDNKFGSATNTKAKEKGGKEKSKNGSKSAKKVVIDDERDKSSANVTVLSQIELESGNQSPMQIGLSAGDMDGSSGPQITRKPLENDMKQGNSQVLSIPNEDSVLLNEEELENNIQDSFKHPSSIAPPSSNGNASIEPTAIEDQNEETIHVWASNLRNFFDVHFLPAFQMRKCVDRALKEQKHGQANFIVS